MSKKHEPISIDTCSRNSRLKDTLLNMGLVVVPIYTDEITGCIDHFIVSSGIPKDIVEANQCLETVREFNT